MKLAIAQGGAGIEAVTLSDQPAPEAGPGQALVRLTAATLNFHNLLGVRGQLAGVKQPGYVPLCDGAARWWRWAKA